MAPTAYDKTQPIVVSGPSGSGKSTLVGRLQKEYPGRFGFSISHTTRNPRGQEQDGVEYHFVSKDDFKKLIDENGFIEHAQFGSNFYGTSLKAVKDITATGQTAILDIEMEGVKQVKKTDHLKPRYVFIQPPSMEILEQRLRGRGTDKEEDIQKRLTQAKNEIEFSKQEGVFDEVIVNDDLETCWKKFKTFIFAGTED